MHPDNKYLPSPIWQESLGKLMLFLLKDIVVTLLLFIIAIAPIIVVILYAYKKNLSLGLGIALFFSSATLLIVYYGIMLRLSWEFLENMDILPLYRIKHFFCYKKISQYTSFVSLLNDNENSAIEKYEQISGRSRGQHTDDISDFLGKYIDKYYNEKFFKGHFPDYRNKKGELKEKRDDIVRFRYMLKHKNEILSQQQQIIDKCMESAYINMLKKSNVPYRWAKANVIIGYRQLHLIFHENVTLGLSCGFLKRIPQTIPLQWKDYFEHNTENFSEFINNVIDFSKSKDEWKYNWKPWWEERIDELFSALVKRPGSEISLINFKTNICFFQDKLKSIGLQQHPPKITWISQNKNVDPLTIDHILIFEEATIEEISEYVFNELHINDLPLNHRVTIFILFLRTTEAEMGIIIEKEFNEQKSREEQKLLKEKRQKEESERLQREKEEELRKNEEQRRKNEEALRRFDEFIREANQKLIARLHNAISNWSDIEGFPYYAHVPYFPNKTLHTFIQQDAQKLVLDFKNGDFDIQKIYSEQLVSLLKNTFKDDLARLTFACIPASNIKDNESRYKSFSSAICENTGMKNAYEHIKILESATSKHLGGTSSQLIYDSDFFNGRYVILFDDIITTGKTVLNMKQELEHIGAEVICAISFGITTQDPYYSDAKLKTLLEQYGR